MDVSRQLLFFFSALGAFNGFLLSFYFAFLVKHERQANYFLAGLLFVVSTRIAKSVFFFFTTDLSTVYIQLGLSALILIGPLLYLYVDRGIKDASERTARWWLHLIPPSVVMTLICYYYPYQRYDEFWGNYIRLIYYFWFVYVLATGYVLRDQIKRLWSDRKSLNYEEVWALSILFGVTFIWIGYRLGSYTSYIVGALSFSFVFYLLLLLWLSRGLRRKTADKSVDKYANKKIESEEASKLLSRLAHLMEEKELYQNADLKLPEVAAELGVLPHYLSQVLNDNLGKNFPRFINEYRIEAAKQCLARSSNFTLEAIGYDCGFNSKSTFFTTFKKITGLTPAAYRKQIGSSHTTL